MKVLDFNGKECTGCLSCQLACSFYWLKLYNPEKAVLRVRINGLDEPAMRYCRHCEEPACVEACGFDAMRFIDGLVTIDKEKCIGCGLCAESCPYDAIFLVNDIAMKCNQCEGLFNCAQKCSTGALSIIEKNERGEG
ncbi:MAG: hypothetical protein HPY66_1758 [Firmicutes bacterium]|nr:hypothetical protein [Bacillota bacterium]MDI6706565.1 4Fe-4S dicluster domain-containing protein [Bacillota bacterium]